MKNATPTEYVWKYNPLSGTPSGAQQNYGSTVDWVVPGGRVMYAPVQTLRSSVPSEEQFSRMIQRFESLSDQQPFANAHETSLIAANVADSGPPRSALRPIDYGTRQRIQLAGGMYPVYGYMTEGAVQLSGGMTEGRVQISGGLDTRRPPRWCGTCISGNGMTETEEVVPDNIKYELRTQGPAIAEIPNTYSQREFMTTHPPMIVQHPFRSSDPYDFPAQFSSLYKGKNAFENTFWSW